MCFYARSAMAIDKHDIAAHSQAALAGNSVHFTFSLRNPYRSEELLPGA